MTRKEEITFWKRQKTNAKIAKEVSTQNYNIAAQLESEADRALALLGNKPERTRKGDILSDNVKLQLMASLTAGNPTQS